MSLFKDLKLENTTSWSKNNRLCDITTRSNSKLCESKILAETSFGAFEGEFIRKFTNVSLKPVAKVKRKTPEKQDTSIVSPTAPDSDCRVTLSVQQPSYENENVLVFDIENNVEDVTEGFLVKPRCNNDILKLEILNMICCALFDNRFEDFKKCAKHTLGKIAMVEPEFILKAAIYCRRELNIRTVANYMLALACSIKEIRPFIEKYFSTAVRLPSDWIEVAQYYHSLENNTNRFMLPKVLRRSMTMKFLEFNDYQLAKHNKNRGRKKNKSKKDKNGGENVLSKNQDTASKSGVRFTLKYLIRYLHISNPIRSVMCLLGKPYPKSALEFVRLGLGDEWDFRQAGKRMKLPNPVTWETELSAKGNKAEIWEALISSEKLPYMAMLRNLRNLIKVGVSITTHDAVIKKLTSANAVANSKQMPLRFFTAYEVLHTLEQKLKYNALLGRVSATTSRGRRDRKQKSSGIKRLAKKKAVVKPLLYDQALLNRYRRALDVAFGLSIRYNLPPIPGHSIIICNPPYARRKGTFSMHCGLTNDPNSLCFLLTTMCYSLCESASVYFYADSTVSSLQELMVDNKSFTLSEGPENILQNAYILKTVGFNTMTGMFYRPKYLDDILNGIVINRLPVDSLFMFGSMTSSVQTFVSKYQSIVGRLNAIVCSPNLDLLDSDVPGQWTHVPGFTDQVIRFAAEMNRMKGLIEHVDRMDEVYGLDQVQIGVCPRRSTACQSSLARIERPLQPQRWRCARVFISSTFRDMHGERDLICGLLLPELRRLAAHQLRVHLTEVDLRWGVPEEVACSPQAMSLCLEQAANSDLFVLLVGNRYGWTPKQALIDALPQPILQRMQKFYSPGMSITEMEYQIVKHTILSRLPVSIRSQLKASQASEHVRNQVFAFIRDPTAINVIPPVGKLDFEETNENRRHRLNSFKELIKADGVVVMDKYPAAFTGSVQGRPMMSSLNELASSLARVLFRALSTNFSSEVAAPVKSATQSERQAWLAFLHNYVESVAREIAPRQLANLEDVLAKDVLLRGKQCRSLRLLAEKSTKGTNPRFQTPSTGDEDSGGADGCVLLITGCAGCGKTTHLAALAMRMAEPSTWEPHPYRITVGEDQMHHLPTLVSTSSGSVWSRGRRPNISPRVVLAHFSEGLPTTGLTCNRRLYSLLDIWTLQLANDLRNRSVASPILSSMLDQAVRVDQAENGSGALEQDASLGEKVALFKRLVKVAGCLTKVHYAFLLDDADHMQPSAFDWLPDIVPQNMLFVFTCDSASSVARGFSGRPDCLALVVSSLTMTEKAAAVRSLLARYGKVLNETGISNQLLKLVNKRDSAIPLYLKLACEELRLHATFEELDAQIRQLPETTSNLVSHVVARVEADCGPALTQTALGLLCESQTPLATDQLKHLLEVWLASMQQELAYDSQWKNILTTSKGTESEVLIASILEQQRGKKDGNKKQKKYLTPLAFHWLLAGLRPLLADAGDPATTGLDTFEEQGQERAHDWWLRLRSPEVLGAVRSICFRQAGPRGDRLSQSSILGYHKSTGMSLAQRTSASGSKRSKITIEIPSEDGVLQPGNISQINWLLATGLKSVEYMIYHLILAEELGIAFRLLTSPMYLVARISAGMGTRSLVEDFQLFEEMYRRQPTGVDIDISQLFMMRKFITGHYSTLCSHPWLFSDLAFNQSPDNWIHGLGKDILQNPLHSRQADHRLLRCSWPFPDAPATDKWMSLSSPVAVYKCPTSEQTHMTALAMSPDGELMAYGTSTGTVALFEVRTMRERCTYYGHSSSILSLCFICKQKYPAGRGFASKPGELSPPGSAYGFATASAVVVDDCWLVSTSSDGTANVWSTVKGAGSLICLTNSQGGSYPRRPVTSAAWHPDRRLLATGSLDCTLMLWNLGWSADVMEKNMAAIGNRGRKLNYTRFRTGGSPVNAVAFRLPDQQLTEIKSHEKWQTPCDVVAAGCWDGTVRLYDLLRMRPLRVLIATSHSITSLVFSPGDGGSMLAAQDMSGQMFMWNSDNLSLLGGVLTATPTVDKAAPSNWSGETSVTDLSYHGQICFSQPAGRHLIQSTSNGLLKVWSGQLGVGMGSWLTITTQGRMQETAKVDQAVSAFTCDPRGEILISGLTNGDVLLTDCSSGRQLPIGRSVKNPSHPLDEHTRTQSVACSLIPCSGNAPEPQSSLLAVFGFASGAVRVYQYQVTYTGSGQSAEKTVVHSASLIDVYWPHSTHESRVADSGGTLCVAVDEFVVVSGGGNCQCSVSFFAPKDSGAVVSGKRFNLLEPSSAVTAVALDRHFLAAGTNARVVHIYSLDRQEQLCTPHQVVGYAARDWITSLSWLRAQTPASSDLPILIVGSLDQNVSIFGGTSERNWKQLDSTRGPGGAVVVLSTLGPYVAAGSLEGKVRLWQYNAVKRCLDTQTTLDWSLPKRRITDDGSEPLGRVINLRLVAAAHTELADQCNDSVSNPPREEAQKEEEDSSDEDMDMETGEEDVNGLEKEEQEERDGGARGTRRVEIRGKQDARLSGMLRLVVGQQVSTASSPLSFRFRTFAPLLPELCYTLPGHSGLPVNGLVAGPGQMVVSLASRSEVSVDLSGDIRFWHLFSADDNDDAVSRLEHCQPVTCLDAQPKERPCVIVSGSQDGTVILFMGDNFTKFENGSPSNQHSETFVPALRLSFGEDQVVALTSGFPIGCSTFRLVVAVKNQIWYICLPASLLLSLRQRRGQCMTINQLLHLVESVTDWNPDGLTVTSIKIPMKIVEIASFDTQCGDVLVSCDDGFLRAVSFLSDRAAVWPVTANQDHQWYRCIRFSCNTVTMCLQQTTFLQTKVDHLRKLRPHDTLLTKDKYRDDVRSSSVYTRMKTIHDKNFKPLELESCTLDSDGIKSITFLLPVGDPLQARLFFYLAVLTFSDHQSVTLNEVGGRKLLEFQPLSSSVSITGVDCTPLNPDAKKLLVAVAASDGKVHVYMLFPGTGDFTKLCFYPTGEMITTLQLSQVEPVQVSVGCRSGKIYVFTITNP